MNYQIYGPYELLKKKAAKGNTLDLSPNALRSFWDAVDDESGVALRMGVGATYSRYVPVGDVPRGT